jgi:trimeric autotransporter adhesin
VKAPRPTTTLTHLPRMTAMRHRTLALALAAGAFLAAAPAPAEAQFADTIQACYIPNTGNIYRVGEPDTQPNCVSPQHVPFTFLEDFRLGSPGILLRLRSGSPLGNRFVVDTAGGVLMRGELGIGTIPAEGSGFRTMWYPYKGAFRTGGVEAENWNDPNIGFYSFAGGYDTRSSGIFAFAFGDRTQATATSAVAFGNTTSATGTGAFAMGVRATAASFTSVAVGRNAWAGTSFRFAPNNQGSAVAIGAFVTADADRSFALGSRASTAGHVGSFVWGGSLDGSSATTDSVQAVADGEFAARAPGGFRFRTNNTLTTGCNLAAGSGVFSCSSSRHLKHGFMSVDGEDVLARIRSIPVTTWSYDAEGSQVRHMGPFAEDFRAAFGLGTDETSIGLLDIDGVNFAAVKALEERTAQLAERTARVEALEARVAELETLVRQLAAQQQK